MPNMTFDTGSNVRVVIHSCHGDLDVTGGDRQGVEIIGDRTLNGRVVQGDGELTINGYHGDLTLKVGAEATIVGHRISGDVTIADVAGVELHSSGGDVTVTNVGDVTLHDAGSDAELKLRGGSAQIGRVGGDLRVEGASTLQIGAVGGDADLVGVQDMGTLGRIGGDLVLRWAGKLTGAASGLVGGDAEIELGTDAAFTLRAFVGGDVSGDGARPVVAEGGSEGENFEHEDDAATPASGDVHGWDLEAAGGELVVIFGDGGEELQLRVGGDLEWHGGRVTSSTFSGGREANAFMGDFAVLGDEMRRFGRDMKMMGRQLAREVAREVRNSTRGAGPGPRPRVHVQFNDRAFQFDADQIDRLTREAREAAASGIARAQEAVERALVNMVSTRGRPPVPPRAPQPPNAPRAAATPRSPATYTGQTVRIEREAPEAARSPEEVQEEKLAILRMVSEGRLAIDEAEAMLRALEGRG